MPAWANGPGTIARSTAGLKARSKTLEGRLELDGAGLQPWIIGWTLTWAAGPGWNDDGPLALSEAPPTRDFVLFNRRYSGDTRRRETFLAA